MSTTNGQLLNDVPPSNLRATTGGTCLRGRHLDKSAGLADCPPEAGADRLRPLLGVDDDF